MQQPNDLDDARLDALFTYQDLGATAARLGCTPEDVQNRYNAIRGAALEFARVVRDNCPPCADRSAAIRQIREARMTANAAIALAGI